MEFTSLTSSVLSADKLFGLFHYTPNPKYSQAAKMGKINSGNVVRISEYAEETKIIEMEKRTNRFTENPCHF